MHRSVPLWQALPACCVLWDGIIKRRVRTGGSLVETARARRLSTGQAPYSQLMDQIEAQWVNAPSAAD